MNRSQEVERRPEPMMEQGLPIPRALERNFPAELIATPIEDIDPFYRDQPVSDLLSPAHH